MGSAVSAALFLGVILSLGPLASGLCLQISAVSVVKNNKKRKGKKIMNYLTMSKGVIGAVLFLGLLYPLGGVWYLAFLPLAVGIYFSYIEGKRAMATRTEPPRHHFGWGILVLAAVNVAKLIWG